VSFRLTRGWSEMAVMTLATMAVAGGLFLQATPARAQAELTRKVKTKIAPAYPDLARRMNIAGTVKVLVVVLPNGSIKDSKVVGGNPVLANAAIDALKKWKFETASEESTGTVEFKFQPQ
jgi:TonB family protein